MMNCHSSLGHYECAAANVWIKENRLL